MGTGAKRYREVLDVHENVRENARVLTEPEAALTPSPALLASLAHGLDPLTDDEVRSLEPVYLRESEAVRKRLRPIDPNA